MEVYNDVVYFNWTIVAILCNTLITFLILKHLLYKPVKKVLDSREEEVKKIYDDAAAAEEKATALKLEYEMQLSTAKEQANEILKTATHKAQLKSDDIVSEAQNKASAALLRADSQIEIDKKKAMNNIKDDIADLAISAAKQVIKKELDQSSHEKLIEDFIENAGDIQWQN